MRLILDKCSAHLDAMKSATYHLSCVQTLLRRCFPKSKKTKVLPAPPKEMKQRLSLGLFRFIYPFVRRIVMAVTDRWRRDIFRLTVDGIACFHCL